MYEYAKNTALAIRHTPATSPSSPSTKFTAFITTTIENTVRVKLAQLEKIVMPPSGKV
jgi:hypothetical protein